MAVPKTGKLWLYYINTENYVDLKALPSNIGLFPSSIIHQNQIFLFGGRLDGVNYKKVYKTKLGASEVWEELEHELDPYLDNGFVVKYNGN